MITKKNTANLFYSFLLVYLLLWTLIPAITNKNLPLDTIEALAWGSNLDWGFNKHPPFSAFAVEVFYNFFGNQDWAYYLLSQIFVLTAFILVFKLARDFFTNIHLAFFSVLPLEGIFFYNFTTPEFNVNVSQMPFWALSIFFTWRCIKYDKLIDYILLGIFIGIGILTKYLFLYLVLGIKLFFIYNFYKKKIKSYNLLISGPVALLIIFPHLIWLAQNDFITLTYGFQRTGGIGNYLDHLLFPSFFILKQFIILIPFLIMVFFLVKKFKFKKIKFNEKMIFLIFTCLFPIFLMILTSIIIGAKLRTMWMTPFYLFLGLLFMEIYKDKINLKNLKKFYICFLFFFLLSPVLYLTVSLYDDTKRTDYEGKEIARLVQNKWDENFRNKIKVVVGDEWYAGNLSYHLSSRPKWIIDLKEKKEDLKSDEGVIYTGNPKVLKRICPGVYGTIRPVGYCMIGIR